MAAVVVLAGRKHFPAGNRVSAVVVVAAAGSQAVAAVDGNLAPEVAAVVAFGRLVAVAVVVVMAVVGHQVVVAAVGSGKSFNEAVKRCVV